MLLGFTVKLPSLKLFPIKQDSFLPGLKGALKVLERLPKGNSLTKINIPSFSKKKKTFQHSN